MYFLISSIFYLHIFKTNLSVPKRVKNSAKKVPLFHQQKYHRLLTTFLKVIAKASVFFLHLILMKLNIVRFFFRLGMIGTKERHFYKVKWDIVTDLSKRKWTDTIKVMLCINKRKKEKKKVPRKKEFQNLKESCQSINHRQS